MSDQRLNSTVDIISMTVNEYKDYISGKMPNGGFAGPKITDIHRSIRSMMHRVTPRMMEAMLEEYGRSDDPDEECERIYLAAIKHLFEREEHERD